MNTRFDMSRRAGGGFTLVEMIIVISIIMLLSGISFVFFIDLLSPSELMGAAHKLSSVITAAKQVAGQDRVNVMVVFDKDKNTVDLYKDFNNNNQVDDTDERLTSYSVQFGDTIKLHKTPDIIICEKIGYSRFLFSKTQSYEDVYTSDFDDYYDSDFASFEDDVGDLIFITADKKTKLCMDFDMTRGIVRMEKLVK